MNLLLVGCGSLGSILLHAWSSAQLFDNIMVLQPSLSAARNFKQNHAIQFVSHVQDIPAGFKFDVIVLAVKPQIIHEVMPKLSPYVNGSIIVSLLAGVQVAKLTGYLEGAVKIVRVMPNIAMKIGQSTNPAFAGDYTSAQDLDFINQIFGMLGKMIWLAREEQLDLLTPISGSGPAYFFLLAEVLTQITIKQGIEEHVARQIVRQTLLGSAMLAMEADNFETLITSVASKGGVTEAALSRLSPKMPEIMDEAMQAALKRLKELSS
jgi:pyrroline-5-carboxylate reductase